MVITASALSLKVADERASAQFARDHIGFVEEMAHARMGAEGVLITTPLETEPWGERYFQVSDPNGVLYPFVQWMTAEQVSD
jgi:uncharacterized glyoxalase superfamily protein PhnB